jgi:hypothetical protein
MRRLRNWSVIGCFLVLAGCDTDGDGLSNSAEKRLGTDPERADSDGDGIEDGDEMERGTDPLLQDTDGDGYDDNDELAMGSDPTDPNSRIYEGGWPYQPEKDSLDDPGWESTAATGNRIPRFRGVDQFGELVDLYDYANHGVPVAVDLSTHWCAPCKAMAGWISTGDVSLVAGYVWWKDEYLIVRELVETGQIYWVTIIYEDAAHENVGPEAAQEWDEAFPHERIAVLADEEKELHGWIRPTGIPNVNLLTEELMLMDYQDRGLDEAFNMLVDLFGPEQ